MPCCRRVFNPMLYFKKYIVVRSRLCSSVCFCVYILEDLGKCPNGWLERSGSDKCYLFTSGRDSLSWDDAKRSCMLKQGHLVDINSVNERVRLFISYLSY